MARTGVKRDSLYEVSTMWMIVDVGASRTQRDTFIMTVALLFNSFGVGKFPCPSTRMPKEETIKGKILGHFLMFKICHFKP